MTFDEGERTRPIFSRLAKLIWFLLAWSLLIVVACAIFGGLYLYNRVDEEIRSHVELLLSQQYPELDVTVRSARLLELEGFEISGISMAASNSNNEVQPVAVADEVLVRCNPKLNGILQGRVEVREIVARRVAIRCSRDADGSWSIQHLAKLPTLGGNSLPTIRLENSVLEIVDNGQSPPRLFTLRDINVLVTPVGSQRVSHPSATLKVEASLSGDHLQRTTIHGTVNPQTRQWAFEGQEIRVDISSALRDSLPVELTRHCGSLEGVSARARGDFRIVGDPAQTPPVQFTAVGDIVGGRIDDPRFPYPLTDLSAKFLIDNQLVAVREFTARYGTASVVCSLQHQANGLKGPLIAHGRVENLRFDHTLVTRLPTALQAKWQKFQPMGDINAEFNVVIDGDDVKPSLEIDCLDVSVTWEKFPYPLQHARGRVSVRPDQVAFDITGVGGGLTPVAVRGHVHDPGPAWTGWFETQSSGALPIDETLLTASSERLQRVIRPFAARGQLSIASRFERFDANQAVAKHAIIDLHDCSVRHEKFPYPLHDVQGRLEMTGENWVFTNIIGRNDSAIVRCGGSWDGEREGGWLDLQFTGSNIPLEEELRDAISPGSKRIWLQMRPRGTIDQARARFQLAKQIGHKSLTVTLYKHRPMDGSSSNDLSVTPATFPYRIDDVTGSVTWQDGAVQMRKLRGRHGQVAISTSGTANVLPDGSWKVEFQNFTADRFRIDREFLEVAPHRLARAFRGVNLQGPVSVVGSLTMGSSLATNHVLSTGWDLDVDLEGGSLGNGLELKNISGGVKLTGQADVNQVACRGELNIDALTCRDVQLTNLRGPLWFDGHRVLLGAWASPAGQPRRRLTAKLFGGIVACDSQIALDETGQFETRAELLATDFPTLMRDLGQQQAPTKGKAYLQLAFHGNRQGTHTWKGQGRMQLRETNLYELPVVLSLIQTMRTGSTDRSAFSTADVDFRLHGDHAYIDRLDLSGDTLTLKGVGELNRKREINVNFYTVIGREDSYLAAVRPLLGMASRRFLVVKVRGTMDQLEMTREVLPGLNEALQQWFQDPNAIPPTIVSSTSTAEESRVQPATYQQ